MKVFCAGSGIGFLVSLLGWQVNLLALHRGLEDSRRACFLTGLGAIGADLIFILFGYWGGKLLILNPHCWEIFKWMSVATLFVSAYRIWKKDPAQETSQLERGKNLHRHFIFGMLVVLANPLIMMIWLGGMSYLIAYTTMTQDAYWRILFPAGFVLGAAVWFGILSFRILIRIREWGRSSLRNFQKTSAVILVIAGIVMLFEKF